MHRCGRVFTTLMVAQALVLFSSGLAVGGPTGEELRARCETALGMKGNVVINPMAAMRASQCISFVDGLTIGLVVGNLLSESGRTYCPPEDFTPVEAVTIIQKFFVDYPQLSGEDAGVLASDALITAHPCPQSDGKRLGALRH